MIEPKHKSKSSYPVTQDEWDGRVEHVAQALLPTILASGERAGFGAPDNPDFHASWCIDRAFEIGEAFACAAGYVVDTTPPGVG